MPVCCDLQIAGTWAKGRILNWIKTRFGIPVFGVETKVPFAQISGPDAQGRMKGRYLTNGLGKGNQG